MYTGDHKLWASFTFLLRSTANLRDLGFDDVPLHDSPNPPDTDTYPTIAGQSAENAIEASSSVGQADNSMDALFVDDAEYDAQSPQSVVQSKKAVIRKMSKKASTTEQVEQPKTSTILDNLAKNAKKGKAAAVHATTGGENKLEVESKPKSKPEDNEPETHEEYVARKKAELVISGVKAAPAHQAYLQRAATEEPEEDDDHMEFMPGTSTQSSMPDILPHSIQSVPSTPILHSQRLLGRRSSPPALDLMATPSTSTNQEILTYGLPAFLSTPLSSRQVFSAHLQDARRPSMPTLASSTLSSPCIREVTTHSMPGLTDTIRASTAQVLSMDVQKRRPFDVAMTSDSRPSTLPNREVEIYSVAGLSNSPILNGQPLPIHEAGAGPSLLSMASESSPSTPSNGDILNCMPGLYIAPHPIAQVISATTTLERRPSTQSFRPAVQRLGEPVTRPASRSSKLEAFASGGTFGWDSVSSFAESSRMNSPQASGAVMGPGYKITASNFEISTTSRMLSSELRRTTRPSTPEPTEIQIELPNQPEIEDTHMLGKPRLTSTLPSETQSEVQPQIHPRDFRSLLSIRPSSPAPFEMQVDTTRREEPQTISAIRQSSPVPSETPTETPTETATEVASLDALETSRKSSQRDIAACYNNGCTAFQAASTPNQTFNHTEESPILGSSQRLMAVHEASLMTPVTTQARLHWQNHTPLNEDLPKVQDVQRSFLGQDQEGNITLHSVPSLVVKLKGNPTIHPNPVVQPTHVQLMSPPLSIQKRKADNIGGTDPDLNTPQRKVPSSQDQSVWGHSQFVQENRALQSRQAVRTNSTYQHQKTQRHKMSYFEHRPNREEYELWTGRQGNVQAETEELRERDGAERTNITAAEQQGRENEPHWEEIRRQNEVARARMATAEQQRKELQARYEVAMEVQKERENVHELNKEAERLERENAKLQVGFISSQFTPELIFSPYYRQQLLRSTAATLSKTHQHHFTSPQR